MTNDIAKNIEKTINILSTMFASTEPNLADTLRAICKKSQEPKAFKQEMTDFAKTLDVDVNPWFHMTKEVIQQKNWERILAEHPGRSSCGRESSLPKDDPAGRFFQLIQFRIQQDAAKNPKVETSMWMSFAFNNAKKSSSSEAQ